MSAAMAGEKGRGGGEELLLAVVMDVMRDGMAEETRLRDCAVRVWVCVCAGEGMGNYAACVCVCWKRGKVRINCDM